MHKAALGKGAKMRKYYLFSKPAKVADVLQEDLNSDISSSWEEKAEQKRVRRWHKIRLNRAPANRKTIPKRYNAWRNKQFGQGRAFEA
jgi:hypothetical protein